MLSTLGLRFPGSSSPYPQVIRNFSRASDQSVDMAMNPTRTLYIGNLDEKVSERVLYEILIQVGHVVDLYIPRDKETNHHRGYAFAEYESEEIAEYAVKLFSGLVRLHNKTIKFAISGRDKSFHTTSTLAIPKPIFPPLPKPYTTLSKDLDVSRGQISSHSVAISRFSGNSNLVSPIYPQASYNGLVSHASSNNSYVYSRQVFGPVFNSIRRPSVTHPVAY